MPTIKNAFARVAFDLLAASIASVATAQDAVAPLATVQSVTGNVLISTADGYQPLTADTVLKAAAVGVALYDSDEDSAPVSP